MSHIHIPDGVLPFWIWGTGWLLALIAVLAGSKLAERSDVRRKVPLLGVTAALMLVAMSSEIVPIAYHINLTVLTGVVLGPALGVIAAFVVVAVLAMIGHGGVTVIGLNTLVIGSETVLGWALFHGLVRLFGRKRAGTSAALATVVTLAVSTTLLVGIVALAGGGAATYRETGALDPANMQFKSPFSQGVFSVGLLKGAEKGAEPRGVSVKRFAAVVYTLGPIGWIIEALVTAGIVRYVARVRPALIFEARVQRRLPADETTER